MRLPAYYAKKIKWDDDHPELEVEIKRLSFEEASEVRSQVRNQLEDALRVLDLQKKGEPVSGADVWTKREDLRRDVIERYARMKSHLEVEREPKKWVAVKTGADILNDLGGNPDFIEAVFEAVIEQTRLTPKEKKDSKPLADSKPSSEEPSREATGPKPETTAASAESEDSANGEGVMHPAPDPSGSTATAKEESPPSSPTSAPSSH